MVPWRVHMQAKPYLNDCVAQGLVDPRLGDGGYDGAQLRRLMFVASLCVRPAAAWRPTMTQVRRKGKRKQTFFFLQLHLLFHLGVD